MDLLAADFPALLPEDSTCRAYSGYIRVQV